ncbi:plasma membrane fusion protein prm1 [Ascosphaera acerosa]|nr:plasma membrane fusion protein prm1 [Ascosphaera acerosa]
MAAMPSWMPSSSSSSSSSSSAPPRYTLREPPAAAAAVATTTVRPDTTTPYLGFKSRLSQTWLNRWTILILLVLARLLLSAGSLDASIASAEREALSACRGVETTASAVASMPHYMAGGLNELTAMGLERSVHALLQTLDLIIMAVEEMTVWYVNMVTGMYMCLITFAVRGSMHAAVHVLEEATDFLNKTVGKLGSEVGEFITAGGHAINKIGEHAHDFFSGSGDHDGFSIDTSKLQNKLSEVRLPPGMLEPLEKLNASLPTFQDVRNFTNSAIRKPFDEVRGLISKELPAYRFNASTFPVPDRKSISFCTNDNGIDDFFSHVAATLKWAKMVLILVLVIAAVLACLPMAYRELRSWRLMRRQAAIVHQCQEKDDPMDVVYQVSRPHTARVGLKLARYFDGHASNRGPLVRWLVAYVTSPAALFVLCLGVAGLLSCLCQYILLRVIERVVPQLTGEMSEFSDKVVQSVQNASVMWANGTNAIITHTNDDINRHVFGWVNTTTQGVNTTLNTFMDHTMGTLNSTFGGTLLEEPLKTVFDCIIGMKVEAVQKGLTWVSEHAHIDFPHVPNDTFSLALQKSAGHDPHMDAFLAHPGDSTADAVSSAIVRVVSAFRRAVLTEAIISAAVCGIWLVLVMMGLARVCCISARREKPHGEGGEKRDTRPDDDGLFDVPLHSATPIDPASIRALVQQTPPAQAAPLYSRQPIPGEVVAASSPLPTRQCFAEADYRAGQGIEHHSSSISPLSHAFAQEKERTLDPVDVKVADFVIHR